MQRRWPLRCGHQAEEVNEVLHVQHEGAVLTATLDTPPANALDRQELTALGDLIRRVDDDPGGIRALVIRGGDRFFSGGVSINMISESVSRSDGADAVGDFGSELQAVLNALEKLSVPTVAAMRGSAVGGGLELALACDLRVAGVQSSYGLPESKLGLIPGGGGTQRLTEVAGRGTALRLILLGELVSGAEAERLGIVQWSCPNDAVDDFAVALAARIADLSPTALAAAKRCIAVARSEHGFALEVQETRTLLTQNETQDRLERFLSGSRQDRDAQ